MKRFLWLRGPAGVGKSAIIQTLAEHLADSQRLGASLFFSRPNGRANPQQVFPTIAYQLATLNLEYREYIANILRQDPLSLEKAMSDQFQLLIVEPFVERKLKVSECDLLIAIDGLDKCDGDPVQDGSNLTKHRSRTSEEVHRELMWLISNFVQNHPFIPFIWIIASRPEVHIKAVFSSNLFKDSFVEEDIPVDSEEACQDVERFLHASFTKVREDYPEYFDGTLWPTHQQFLLITKAASGLFVFAEVVVRFIRDSRVGNPIAQLKYVLSAISKLNLAQNNSNPLAVLDAIYATILAKIPSDTLDNTKKLLQLLIFANHAYSRVDEFHFKYMYEYLGMNREDAISAFRHLHSVISFSQVTRKDENRPRFYHASFQDYLMNPSRSFQYSISTGSSFVSDLFQTHLLDMFGRSGV
jgi:hypothetical protein